MLTKDADPLAAVVVIAWSFIFMVAPYSLSLDTLDAQVTTHLESFRCCTHFTSLSPMICLMMVNRLAGAVFSGRCSAKLFPLSRPEVIVGGELSGSVDRYQKSKG